MIKRAKEKVQLDNIMKSRLLYHKYLQKQNFKDIIQPGKLEYRRKINTLVFILFFVLIVFWFKRGQTVLTKKLKDDVDSEILQKSPKNIELKKSEKIKNFENSGKNFRLDKFTQNLFFLILIISILFLTSYMRIVSHPEANFMLNSTQNLLSQFSILYLIIYSCCILYSKSSILHWKNYEKLAKNRVKIYRRFEKLYIKSTARDNHERGKQKENSENVTPKKEDEIPDELTKNEKSEYSKLKRIVKYIVLRQEFLCPTFTPIFKEKILRDDFDFSSYLSKCIYKTINSTLDISFSTLFSFILFLFSYAIFRILVNEVYEIALMVLFSLTFFGFLVVIKYKAERIFCKLSHPLTSPYEFQVTPFDAVRNPQGNLGKIFIPFYLKEENFENFSLTKNQIVNSHEALFWLGSSKFCMKLLHFWVIFYSCWTLVFLNNYWKEIFSTVFKQILAVLSIFMYGLGIGVVLPVAIRHFSIVTNVIFF